MIDANFIAKARALVDASNRATPGGMAHGDFIGALALLAPMLLDEIERLRGALQKVSDIRDSIVGLQGFDFSEHAYPLVAVLNEAGFEGAGYKIARKNLGTLIDQIKAMTAARNAACEIAEAATFVIDNALCHSCRSAIDNVSVESIDALRKVGAL